MTPRRMTAARMMSTTIRRPYDEPTILVVEICVAFSGEVAAIAGVAARIAAMTGRNTTSIIATPIHIMIPSTTAFSEWSGTRDMAIDFALFQSSDSVKITSHI